MSEEAQVLAESKTKEAANAVAVAEEAKQSALAAQLIALQNQNSEHLANIVASTMREGFRYAFTTPEGEQRKFVDTSQLHRICDDISGINQKMATWEANRVTKDDYMLLKQRADFTTKIVIGFCALILIAFVTGLTVLVFK